MHRLPVLRCVQVFGASPARAKEVYTVTFEDQTSSVSAGTLHDPISTDVDTRVQQARKCLTRALLKQYENVAAWQEALPGARTLYTHTSATHQVRTPVHCLLCCTH